MLSIDRASRMIDQLLTLSRLDGMVAWRASAAPIRLDLIASHVIDEVRPLLSRSGQSIDVRLAPCQIEGMEFGVASLLRNLVDNALRYGPPSSAVRVTVGPRGDQSVATVEDAGPGIPVDERERVFQRFYRLYNEGDGCGIGLSIVRAVADVHRAQIELGDSDLGGLRVTVSFPRAPAAG
jgi:two-component system, OmpR family, sensor histidine kinase QseC